MVSVESQLEGPQASATAPEGTASSSTSERKIAPGYQADVPTNSAYGHPIYPSVPPPGPGGGQQYGGYPSSQYPMLPSGVPSVPMGTSLGQNIPGGDSAWKGSVPPGGISGGLPPVSVPPSHYAASRPAMSNQRIFSPAELLLLLILAVLLPPAAVAIKYSCNFRFWICLLLTILGHIPGAIYAVCIIVLDS